MNYKGKTCIVTGAAGAIGSRLCKRLLDLGAIVVGYDDLSSGHKWLVPEHENMEMHFGAEGDIRYIDRDPKPDGCVVFHLAAHFANQNSVDHPEEDLIVNGVGTLRVLEWAAGSAEKVVFASAGCAAGHKDTPYQIHKTLGEHYCAYYANRVPTVVCRFHNSYGPGEVPGRYRNVIPNWIWAAMHNRPLTIYGDGTDGRDFIFVEDLIEDLISCKPGPGYYELGTGKLTQTAYLARAILALTKSSSTLNFEPSRRWDHKGKPSKVAVRRKSLSNGLALTYAWVQENADKIKESVDE